MTNQQEEYDSLEFTTVENPEETIPGMYNSVKKLLDHPGTAEEKIRDCEDVEKLQDTAILLYHQFFDNALTRHRIRDELHNIISNHIGEEVEYGYARNKEMDREEFFYSVMGLAQVIDASSRDDDALLQTLMREKRGLSSWEKGFIEKMLEAETELDGDGLSISSVSRIMGRAKATVSEL